MAIPLVIPNAAQVRLMWTFQGELAVNVLGASITAPPTFNQALAESLGSAIKTAATTHLGLLMAASVSLVRVGVRDLRTANQPEFRDTGAAAAMSGTGDPLPRGVAACMTLRTDKSGKSFRGRVYLGGFTENQSDTNGIQAVGVGTGGAAFLNAVDTALAGQGMQLAVLSRPSERITIVKTTFHADGTTSSETLSSQQARSGQATEVKAIESRSANWEYQRRRGNTRGGSVALLTPNAVAFTGST